MSPGPHRLSAAARLASSRTCNNEREVLENHLCLTEIQSPSITSYLMFLFGIVHTTAGRVKTRRVSLELTDGVCEPRETSQTKTCDRSPSSNLTALRQALYESHILLRCLWEGNNSLSVESRPESPHRALKPADMSAGTQTFSLFPRILKTSDKNAKPGSVR